MKKNRLLSVLLVLCMLLALLPGTALAADETSPFTEPEPAALYLRQQMEARADHVEFNYMSPDDADLSALRKEILALAYSHTGTGTQGDYLRWQVGAVSHGYQGSYVDDMLDLDIYYDIEYYTTSDEEAELTGKLTEVLDSLELDGKSDYEKFDAIYDYVVLHVVYDHENLNDDSYDLKYTAYAALVNGTAVCQGYSNLLYRMLLEAGLDCRVITGTGWTTDENGISTGEGHAWNIVRLGSLYYNVDATWDASGVDVYVNGEYQGKEFPMTYRLRGSETFPDHDRDEEYLTEEFLAAYPMSTADYTPPEPMTARISSASLTLAGDIGVNYYMIPDADLLADEGAYARFTVKNTVSDKIPLSGLTPDAKGRIVLTRYMAAKEMTEQIALRLYSGDGTQVTLTSASGSPLADNAAVYSIARYVNKVSDSTKALAQKLASFGAYAQAYFGYTPVTPDAAYASAIAGADVSAVTADTLSDFATTRSGAVTGVTVSGVSLTLESLTTLNVSFTGKAITSCAVTINGSPVTPVKSGSAYVVRISNIAGKDLDKTYTVVIRNGSEALTLTACALSYARNTLRAYADNADKAPLCDMVRALYEYNAAANDYFG